jgi:hypothetical protein
VISADRGNVDSYTAGICSAVLGLLPMVLLFENSVMLEIPWLALGVAAILHWIGYLEQHQRRSLYLSALWLSAALLFKQTSVHLLVFWVLTLLVTGQGRRIVSRDAVLFAAIIAVLAGPFLTLMLFFLQEKAVANDLGSRRMRGWERITYFGQTLTSSFAPTLLVLALLGAALAFRWDVPRRAAIMGCWVLSGYLTFSWFGQREARFTVYWFPLLVYFVVGLITRFFRVSRVRVVMRAAAALLIVTFVIPAWRYQRPHITGYKEIASRNVENYDSGIILFDGSVPGNFVFFVRALDPGRRFVTLRKILYADDIRLGPDSEESLHSKEEGWRLSGAMVFALQVVSQNRAIRFDSQRILREQPRGDDFTLLQQFPVTTNELRWRGENLLLYDKKNWTPPKCGVLKIRMLTLPHDIEIPLGELSNGKH